MLLNLPMTRFAAALLGTALSVTTSVAQTTRDYEVGAAYVAEKLEEARIGKLDEKFLTFLLVQTDMQMRSGQYSTAVHTAEPLAQLFEIKYGSASEATAGALEALGEIYINIERLEDGRSVLQRAVSIHTIKKSESPVPYLRSLNSLAAVHLLLSDPKNAAILAQQSLDFASATFGQDSAQSQVARRILETANASAPTTNTAPTSAGSGDGT